MDPKPRSPVFYDPKGQRRRHLRRTYLALGVVITSVAAIFIASVLANPLLPRLNLRPLPHFPKVSDIKPPPLQLPPASAREQKARKAQAELQKALATTRVMPAKRAALMPLVPPPNIPLPTPVRPASKPLSIGFYVNWDESSYASLKRNLDHLDWVIAQWSHIQDTKSGGSPLDTDIDVAALNLIRQDRPQISILPMVQNLNDEKWESDVLARAVIKAVRAATGLHGVPAVRDLPFARGAL